MSAYRDTVLLPKTDYPQQARLPALEPRIRQRWQEIDLYGAIRTARAGREKWILHDGPPYANGDLHVGTGQNKVLKDIVVRFRTMQGFDAPFVPGWDCHGLPIEHQILKELGADGEAPALDAAAVRERCERYALHYVDRQRRQFEELGVLADWDHPYLTLAREYELGVIEMFEQLVARGRIYRGHKPIKWCVTHKTALAEAEVEYRKHRSPAIYLAFPMIDAPREWGEAVDLLVWTTTPWTLPGNVAAAVHPTIEYVACRYRRRGPDSRQRVAVLARERYSGLAERLDLGPDRDLGLGEIVASFPGTALEGLHYAHPLWGHPCPVVLASYVTAEDGTGVVHTAPGHGEEDFETGQTYGLATLSPVDATGHYTADAREWAGRHVFDANALIVDRLRASGLLLDASEIEHDYPCCWRCKTPLIHRATPQWFISMGGASPVDTASGDASSNVSSATVAATANDGRAQALDAVERTHWVPAWGATRMRSMLRERPDWCISRQRTWGVPIPAFYCTACEQPAFDFPAVKAFFARGGANAWFTTTAEEILSSGSSSSKACACGETRFRKETDIFDVWFESGASQHSVLRKHPALAFPADLYLEGTDQHRGWFQASLLECVLTGHGVPFRTVVTNGFLVDPRTGDKLSKSGYLVPTEEVAATFGSDLFRLWVASRDFTDDIPFSREILAARAPYYVKIRNTFRYLLGSVRDFDPAAHAPAYGDLLEIDRWALHQLAVLVRDVARDFDAYAFHLAMQRLYQFCVVTMSGLYFDVVKDRLYTFGESSLPRRSAQTALHAILQALVRLYAPVLAHSCEEVWEHLRQQRLPSTEASVHLASWPEPPPDWHDERLAEKYERLFAVRGAVNRALERLREAGTIGRSLDARVSIHAADPVTMGMLAEADREGLFIVSESSLAAAPVGDEDADLPGVWVRVERSPHARCERCWARRPSVGECPAHPQLCDRCVTTVSGV